jgi:hypothetical protein
MKNSTAKIPIPSLPSAELRLRVRSIYVAYANATTLNVPHHKLDTTKGTGLMRESLGFLIPKCKLQGSFCRRDMSCEIDSGGKLHRSFRRKARALRMTILICAWLKPTSR